MDSQVELRWQGSKPVNLKISQRQSSNLKHREKKDWREKTNKPLQLTGTSETISKGLACKESPRESVQEMQRYERSGWEKMAETSQMCWKS